MHSQLSCHCPSTRTLAFSWFSSPSSQKHTPSTLSFSSNSLPVSSLRLPHCPALKTSNGGRLGSQDANDPSLLRKPSFSASSADDDDDDDGLMKNKGGISDESMDVVENSEPKRGSKETDSKWVDWEDQILEDTVPLVGFVRMILHSGKYESGARLSQEHEKIILERLLPYHPEYEKKIGCGIDFITTGYHPDFESSRCLFIVRKDGELVDFSFWKCIKGLIKKKYPLYADSFILRHFRRRRHNE